MFQLPPPRYIVKEEGRRLVTIDTTTGERVGLAARPVLDEAQAATVRRLDSELSADRQQGPADGSKRTTAQQVKMPTNPASPRNQPANSRSALDPGLAQPSDDPAMPARPQRVAGAANAALSRAAQPNRAGGQGDNGRAGRVITLAAVGFVVALFLIMTYLWVIVAILLAIPPVRTSLLTVLKREISKYLDGTGR